MQCEAQGHRAEGNLLTALPVRTEVRRILLAPRIKQFPERIRECLVAREGKASTSFVQRYLQIGYNRAARIIEEMERQGVISKANAVGKREVLVGNFDKV